MPICDSAVDLAVWLDLVWN